MVRAPVQTDRSPNFSGGVFERLEAEMLHALWSVRDLPDRAPPPPPLRLHELGLAVLGAELAVGVKPLGADDPLCARCGPCRCAGRRASGGRAGLKPNGGLLEAVRPHGAQSGIGDKLSAL